MNETNIISNMTTVQWFVMTGMLILNPLAQISKAGAQFKQPGVQY